MKRIATLVGIVATIAALFGGQAVAGPGPEIQPVSLGIFDGTIAERKALKTTWIRTGAHWGQVEPVPTTPATYDWTNVDAQIVPASRKGLNPLFAIRAISSWGSNCGPYALSGPKPEHMVAFKAWVQAAAERYDGDGTEDAPGLGATPVNVWQVENQWVTAVFYRDSSNCPAPGMASAEGILGSAAGTPPETTGDPVKAAKEFVAEYKAVVQAVHAADPDAVIGLGNIPTQTADAALFCQGKLGPRFIVNVLKVDGTVKETRKFTKAQVCNKAGANTNNIKTWVRYWNVVLERVMPKIASQVDYLDLAHYGRYQDVQLRNEWLLARAVAWGFTTPPQVVAWEAGGPDRRVTVPGADPAREVSLDVLKRIPLAFATGNASIAWFHNHFNEAAAVGVRYTSLLDESGQKTAGYWNYRLLAGKILGALGATLTRRNRTGPGGGAYLVQFDFADGHRVTVAWADKGMSNVVIDVDTSQVKVITPNGKKFPATKRVNAPSGTIKVNLTEVPVLIVD